MGLHRYNLLQGKDLQLLHQVKKYNKSVTAGCVVSTYYITCRAKDPAPRGTVRTFQAVVREGQYNRFVLTCSVARFKGKYMYCIIAVDDKSTTSSSSQLKLPVCRGKQ